MRRLPVLVLAAALLVLLASTRALAASVVPSGPVLGDGRTPATIRVWIPDLQAGERLKLKPDEGRTSDVVVEGSVASFTWFPPPVTGPREIGFTLQRKSAEERVVVPVVPPWEGRLQVSFDPPALLAESGTALVRVTPSASVPQEAQARRFLLQASAGTIETPMPAGDGTWVARYTPPADLEGPRTVIITAADASAPDAVFGWGALPLRVRRSVSVQVEPDASTVLTVGDRTYGPLTASPAGTVAFDLELDPTLPTARVQSVTPLGQRADTVMDLPRPDHPRVALVPLPPAVPADPALQVPIRIVATTAAGGPVRMPIPTLRVSAGQVTAVETTAEPGVFEAIFSPPKTKGNVLVTATFDGGETTASMELIPAMPRLALEVSPEVLPAGKRDFVVTAQLRDASGTGIPGLVPALEVTGATLYRKPKDNGDGTYTSTWRLDAKAGAASVRGVPPMSSSGLHVHRLLAWSSRPALLADGTSTLDVTVAAVDRFGMPVPDVEVTLSVPASDATLTPTVRTGPQGLARAELKAGTTSGLLNVQAVAAGLLAQTPVFQVAEGETAPAISLGGDADSLTTLSLWRSTAAMVHVSREGAAPATAPPAVVQVRTIPPYTTPGAAILVTVEVVDAAGQPVPGARPRVVSTVGTPGAVTDNRDGTYTLPLQLGPGQDGPLTLTVTAGAVTGTADLPTLEVAMAGVPAEDPAAEASGGAAGEGPARAASRAAREPRTPRAAPAVDVARMRVQGSLVALAHDYAMTSEDGIEHPQEANFTSGNWFKGDIGGAPALGAALLWRVAPGPARYPETTFLLDLNLQGALESVAISSDRQRSAGLDLRAGVRWRHEVAGPIHAYGLGGLHRTTAILFEYGDETRTTADLVRRGVGGLLLGGGVGAEYGPLWAELELATAWRVQPGPFGPSVLAPRFQVGWEFQPGMYGFLSVADEARTLRFRTEADTVLEIVDQQQPLALGVGGVFR